eukprot:1192208-Prorocentrum_minimum.AAC.15
MTEYAFPYTAPFELDMDLNDVRHYSSKRLDFYLEVSQGSPPPAFNWRENWRETLERNYLEDCINRIAAKTYVSVSSPTERSRLRSARHSRSLQGGRIGQPWSLQGWPIRWRMKTFCPRVANTSGGKETRVLYNVLYDYNSAQEDP